MKIIIPLIIGILFITLGIISLMFWERVVLGVLCLCIGGGAISVMGYEADIIVEKKNVENKSEEDKR